MAHRSGIAVWGTLGTLAATVAIASYDALFERVAAQDASAQETYVGLWQGVDEVDGGYSVRSILPTESGFKVVGRDTWHGPCGYGDPATVLGVLSAEDESLLGTWNLDCQVGETAETGDRAFKVRYTFDPAVGTLTETLLNAQTEQPIDRIPIVFFRVAP